MTKIYRVKTKVVGLFNINNRREVALKGYIECAPESKLYLSTDRRYHQGDANVKAMLTFSQKMGKINEY